MSPSQRWSQVAMALVCFAAANAQPPAAPQGTAPPQANGTIEGIVLGPLGEPMANVDVMAATSYNDPIAVAKTRTDGSGVFVLAHLPTERGLQVIAAAPGLTSAAGYAQLGPDRIHAGVHLRLYDANTVRGRVLDEHGAPVEGAFVIGAKDRQWFGVKPPEVRTDAEGRFELQGVPIGDCVVRVWKDGYALLQYWLVATADATVELKLSRAPGITLAITTEGLDAAAIAATLVRQYPTSGGTGFSVPSALTTLRLDERGGLRIGGLLDVEWNVSLEVPGFTFDPRSVRSDPAGERRDLHFVATPDGALRLHGTLRTAAGAPLADQTLICRTQRSQSMNGGRPGRAVTDADGRWSMDAPLAKGEPFSLFLGNGGYVLNQPKTERHVAAHDPRYRVRWEETADPALELALTAIPAAHLAARLVDPAGQPVQFASTMLQCDMAGWSPRWFPMAYATSDREGQLTFPGVLGGPDELRVHVESESGAGSSQPFRLGIGERHDLVVTCQAPGTVRGRIVDARGKPVAGARLSLRNWDFDAAQQTDGAWTDTPSDRDGRFVFTGVAPGGHYVETGLHGREPAAQVPPFTVEPGKAAEVELRLPK